MLQCACGLSKRRDVMEALPDLAGLSDSELKELIHERKGKQK